MRAVLKSLSVAALLVAGLSTSPADAQTLRFNQITPSSHFFHERLLMPWAKDVEQATDGRVKVEFTGSSLGPMPRQFDMALNGIADLTTGNQAAIPGRFPMTLITELPFLTDSAEAMSVALWRVHQQHLTKADEYKGTKLLTLFTSGPSHLYTMNKEITSLDVLSGMKLRVSGITLEKMAKSFGAVTIATPVSEIYEVISKGVVDGTITTDTSISGWKVEKYIKYQTIVPGGLSYGPFFLVMNQRKWDFDQPARPGCRHEALRRGAGPARGPDLRRGRPPVGGCAQVGRDEGHAGGRHASQHNAGAARLHRAGMGHGGQGQRHRRRGGRRDAARRVQEDELTERPGDASTRGDRGGRVRGAGSGRRPRRARLVGACA